MIEHLLVRFAWTMAEWTILATALLGLAWLATRLNARNAAARHLIWLTCFAILLALPALTLLATPHSAVSRGASVQKSAPATRFLKTSSPPFEWSPMETFPAISPENIHWPKPLPHQPTPKQPVSQSWAQAVVIVWSLGICAILLWVGAAFKGVRSIYRQSESEDSSRAMLLAGRLKVKRALDLRVSRAASPPTAMTWGILKPVVLLPQDAATWRPSRLEAVLLHELAHVRRLDYLSQLVTVLVCAIHWYNPLVWICARALRQESEAASDDAVIRSGIIPTDYAAELLSLAAELGHRRQPAPCLGVSIMKKSRIEARIRSVVNPSNKRSGLSTGHIGSALAGGGIILFVVTCVRPSILTREQAQNSVYEEAVFVLSAHERAANHASHSTGIWSRLVNGGVEWHPPMVEHQALQDALGRPTSPDYRLAKGNKKAPNPVTPAQPNRLLTVHSGLNPSETGVQESLLASNGYERAVNANGPRDLVMAVEPSNIRGAEPVAMVPRLTSIPPQPPIVPVSSPIAMFDQDGIDSARRRAFEDQERALDYQANALAEQVSTKADAERAELGGFRRIEVSPFTRISAGHNIRLIFNPGTSYGVEYKTTGCPDTALHSQVDRGTLRLTGQDGDVLVKVTCPNLEAVELDDAANGVIANRDMHSLDVSLNGGSTAAIVGKADLIRAQVDGCSRLALATSQCRLSGSVNGSSTLISTGTVRDVDLHENGSSIVQLDHLAASNTVIAIDGCSDFKVSGHTAKLIVTTGGASLFRAAGLESAEAVLSAGGESHMSIGRTESLQAAAAGSSHIVYAGNPPLLSKSAVEDSGVDADTETEERRQPRGRITR